MDHESKTKRRSADLDSDDDSSQVPAKKKQKRSHYSWLDFPIEGQLAEEDGIILKTDARGFPVRDRKFIIVHVGLWSTLEILTDSSFCRSEWLHCLHMASVSQP